MSPIKGLGKRVGRFASGAILINRNLGARSGCSDDKRSARTNAEGVAHRDQDARSGSPFERVETHDDLSGGGLAGLVGSNERRSLGV